jgi:lysozyme family protein
VQTALWAFIASQESGKLSLDPKDSGNWNSGICGIGILVGSKWGISAAAFPSVDIQNVTFESAQAICMRQYWPTVKASMLCDKGAAALAMLLVDAAWGSGPTPAIVALQRAVGVAADGEWGSITDAAIDRAIGAPPLWGLPTGLHCLIADYVAERILFESKLGTWGNYEGGWVHRLTRIESLCHSFLPVPPPQFVA